MNITFMIGNGFDLRLGLKTRFTDMYEGYTALPSASAAIRKFKEMLKADAPSYKTWGDFEMAMAQKAKAFDEENDFIECLRDFKLYMVSHLENEQKLFLHRMAVGKDTKSYCMNEATNSIKKFYAGLRPNTINEFARLGVNNDPNYNFISFNYTQVFDNVLSPFMGRVTYIHGKLGADVVLGVDNLAQVKDLPYQPTRRFARSFIKPEFNKDYDNARLALAENIIDSSDIICIYGMSLGESDLSWTKRLKNWLIANKNHHLVYFVHDERTFSKSNWDAIIDEEEDRVVSLLGRICDSGDEMSPIFNQVHIPVGYDIFDIDNILSSEIRKIEDERKRKESLQKRLDSRPRELGV